MKRNHKWNKDDTIITLYYTLHGLNGLPVTNELDLVEGIIGSSLASLTMQAANVRCVLGETEGILTDFSKLQYKVVEEYRKYPADELRNIVLGIIDKRSDLIEDLKREKEEQLRKEREDRNRTELEKIFRRMGKDPKKMKPVVKND